MAFRHSCALGAVIAILFATAVVGQNRFSRWGTQSANSHLQPSQLDHFQDSQNAVLVAGGGDSLLPGATVNSVGVLNQISVVGDDNLIDAIQSGTNTGDVATTLNIGR